MADIKELQKIVLKFRDDREWAKYHTLKDLAISLNLEATEVLEHFLWKTEKDVEEYLKTHKGEIAEEVADTLANVLLLADKLNIDLEQVYRDKMEKTSARYPVDKVKGKYRKYTEIE